MTSPRTPTPSTEPPVWTAGAAGPVDGLDAGRETEAAAARSGPAMDALEPMGSALPAKRRQSRTVPAFLTLAGFIFVAGIAFSIGRTTAPAGTSANGGSNGAAFPGNFVPNASGAPGGPREFGAQSISGTVVSVDGDTMTVKLANGSTVQVATTSSTTYHGQAAASQSDVTAGKTVTVQVSGGGAPNAAASGSTTRTATDVTISGQ